MMTGQSGHERIVNFLETTDCTQILIVMCFWARNAHNNLLTRLLQGNV